MGKMVRGFYHHRGSFYGSVEALNQRGEADWIMVGLYEPPGGGTTGEFRFAWDDLKGEVRLEVFNDAWKALMSFQDLLQKLAERQGAARMAPEDFCKLLLELGVVDLTERVGPKEGRG
jgi:hypothetical protein